MKQGLPIILVNPAHRVGGDLTSPENADKLKKYLADTEQMVKDGLLPPGALKRAQKLVHGAAPKERILDIQIPPTPDSEVDQLVAQSKSDQWGSIVVFFPQKDGRRIVRRVAQTGPIPGGIDEYSVVIYNEHMTKSKDPLKPSRLVKTGASFELLVENAQIEKLQAVQAKNIPPLGNVWVDDFYSGEKNEASEKQKAIKEVADDSGTSSEEATGA